MYLKYKTIIIISINILTYVNIIFIIIFIISYNNNANKNCFIVKTKEIEQVPQPACKIVNCGMQIITMQESWPFCSVALFA